MKNNILPFTGARTTRKQRPVDIVRSNIVSLADWKKTSRATRTSFGVFFMTSVLCTPGDAA